MDANGNYRAVDDVCKYCNKTITAEQKVQLLKKILQRESQEVIDSLGKNKKKIVVPDTAMSKKLKSWAEKGELPVKPGQIWIQGEIRKEDMTKPEILETEQIRFLRKMINE